MFWDNHAIVLNRFEPLEEQPMFIIRQHNGFNTRQGFNEALRLALTLRELGWACCIENAEGQVIAE